MGGSLPLVDHPPCEAGPSDPSLPSSSVPPHVEVEDDLLHQMVEDLLAQEAIAKCEEDCPCVDTVQKGEALLLGKANTPLYEGCTYSTLRACLEILNLQAMFGWSSTSVDALLR